MRLLDSKSVPLLASATVCCLTWLAGIARGNINIELRPAVNTAAPNAIVNIGLYLVSDSAVNQFTAGASVVFSWDNTRLQFLGIDNTGGAGVPPASSGFPVNAQLNEVVPPQDGNGYYQFLSALGSPLAATPAGRLITTFRFRALSTSCSGAFFTILPSGGNPLVFTRVLDGFTPGLTVTGTLGSSLVFIDGVAPVINTCAPAQNLPANASCQAIMPDLSGQISVTDNCPANLTITQTPLAGATLALGPHAVQIQVKDPGNNIAVCNTSVTVVDQSDPQITSCPGAQLVAADATCQGQIPNLTTAVVASDNCTLSANLVITQSPAAGTVVGLGPHNVTITVEDAAGNDSDCIVLVTVEDQTDPQITACPGAQIIPANAMCQAAIPDLTGAIVANDNCTVPASLVISQSPVAGTIVVPGPHNVTLTVEDAAGNAADCIVLITVADQTDPQITTCASDQTVVADAACQAAIPDLTAAIVANDNCTAPASLTISQSPTAGTLVGLGPTVVTITVTDAALNTDTCQATITVEDQTAPSITQCAGPQVVNANGTCQGTIPDLTGSVLATDNCTSTPALSITQVPIAGALVGLGDTVVTISVTDAALNTSTCQATVTVEDNTGPSITQCASDQTVPADASRLAPIPDLTAQVIAQDPCSPPVTVTQSPAAGAIVGLGPHIVTLTAEDAAGNESTCQAVVTVADLTDPVISQCAPSPTLAADANCQAQIPDLTAQVIATDICSPPVVVTQSPVAGTLVGIGPHTVTFTATDAANNSATCDATVTVEDQTPPNITQCASPQTLPADANCQAAIPNLVPQVIATDVCSNPVTVTQAPLAGTLVGIGQHNVILTAEDAAGNESTCIVVITVEDQTDPSISQCVGPQTLAADATCQAILTDLTAGIVAADLCSMPISVTQSPAPGAMLAIGPHNVTFTVEDAAGNDVDCVAIITVADQTDPTITQCAGAQTLPADTNCEALIPDLTGAVIASDLCSMPVSITQSPAAGAVVGIGPHNVTITVEDAAGNDATCVAVVTVADQTDPVISQCASDQTLAADASCQAAIPNLVPQVIATDVCSMPVTVTQSPAAGTLVGMGPHNVTLTATDGAGNDATCVAVITVTDQTAPQITTCPGDQTIAANANCQAPIPSLTGGVVANDNCTPSGSLTITQSPAAGVLVGLGPTVVTISVQDTALNTSTCDVTITVADQTAPTLVGCPTNIVSNTNAGNCAAVVSWIAPTATDNCGTPTVMQTLGPAPGSSFAANSVTTIEYTATDAANNTITCSFTVTVTPSPDMDNDNDVDVADIPIFINVLLGTDTDPVRVARADVNCDGAANGRDVQPFVDILTP